MKSILLDTCIIDYLINEGSESELKFLKDKKVFFSIGTLIELGTGFNKKLSKIDKFINDFNVNILRNLLPILDKELNQYPLELDIIDYIGPKSDRTLQELQIHGHFQTKIREFNSSRLPLKRNIEDIKNYFHIEKINFEDKNEYRHHIKESIRQKITKQNFRLRKVPFNTIFRAFVIEKFVIQSNKIEPQDFNDLLICLCSIYFDYFVVENKNYNVLQSIINERGLKDIFKHNLKIMNLKEFKLTCG